MSTQKKFKGAFIDLDGTLLTSQHIISDRTRSTLNRLCSRGFLIAIATGRSSESVHKFVRNLSLSQSKTYAVCYNGSCGFVYDKDTFDEKVLFNIGLPNEHTRQLLAVAEELDLVAQYYNGLTGEVQAYPRTEEHKAFMHKYASFVGRVQTIRPYEECMKISEAAKILLMASDTEKVIKICKERFPENMFHIINGTPDPTPFFIEYLPYGINKGEGFRKMCELLQLDVKDMITFGDGENDKEMLTISGCGIAMKNAVSQAKDVANIVLEYTNNEDGVAELLERFEREGKLDLQDHCFSPSTSFTD